MQEPTILELSDSTLISKIADGLRNGTILLTDLVRMVERMIRTNCLPTFVMSAVVGAACSTLKSDFFSFFFPNIPFGQFMVPHRIEKNLHYDLAFDGVKSALCLNVLLQNLPLDIVGLIAVHFKCKDFVSSVYTNFLMILESTSADMSSFDVWYSGEVIASYDTEGDMGAVLWGHLYPQSFPCLAIKTRGVHREYSLVQVTPNWAMTSSYHHKLYSSMVAQTLTWIPEMTLQYAHAKFTDGRESTYFCNVNWDFDVRPYDEDYRFVLKFRSIEFNPYCVMLPGSIDHFTGNCWLPWGNFYPPEFEDFDYGTGLPVYDRDTSSDIYDEDYDYKNWSESTDDGDYYNW